MKIGFLSVVMAVWVLVRVLWTASSRRLREPSVATKQQLYRRDELLLSELLCQQLSLLGASLKSRGFSSLAQPLALFSLYR